MQEIEISGEKIIIEEVHDATIAKRFTLTENANLRYILIARRADVTIDIVTTGKHSKAEVACIFLSKDAEKLTANVNAHLQADHSSANLYLLSLLGEKGDCQVDGGVNIAPDVVKTSGHLLEENVILGKKIKIKTLPMLDVRSSDVSASHGAKIDRLDENKLFYMMAKGIDQRQSQRLIVEGYLESIFNNTEGNEEMDKDKMIRDILSYLGLE